MDFSFGLIHFTSNVILFVLFLRYIAYGYGNDMFFHALYRVTNAICRPFLILFPYRLRAIRDYTPIPAMLLVLLARGLIYWLLGFPGSDLGLRLPASPSIPPPLIGMQVSLALFIVDAMMVTSVFLLLGAAFQDMGGLYSSSLLLNVISDQTSRVYLAASRLTRVRNPWLLYVVLLLVVSLPATVLLSVLLLSWNTPFWYVSIFCETAHRTIWIYQLVLLVRILLSWLRPAAGNPVILAIHALCDPALNACRRLFPWARIEMFDLSPIFLFIGVWLLDSAVLSLRTQIMEFFP